MPATGTVAGNYQWDVTYNGDPNNNSTSDNNDPNGAQTVTAASPTLTAPGSASSITLGATAPTLKDSAVFAGGYYETGSIIFTLVAPGATVDTETVPAHGNGTYSTPQRLHAADRGPLSEAINGTSATVATATTVRLAMRATPGSGRPWAMPTQP